MSIYRKILSVAGSDCLPPPQWNVSYSIKGGGFLKPKLVCLSALPPWVSPPPTPTLQNTPTPSLSLSSPSSPHHHVMRLRQLKGRGGNRPLLSSKPGLALGGRWDGKGEWLQRGKVGWRRRRRRGGPKIERGVEDRGGGNKAAAEAERGGGNVGYL